MKIHYQLWLIFSCLFIFVSLAVYIVVSNTYEQRLQTGYEQISISQGHAIINQVKNTYPHTPERSIGYLESYSDQHNSRYIILDDDKKVYADSFQQFQAGTSLNLVILSQDTLPGSHFSQTDSFGYIQYTLIPFKTIEAEGYLLMIQEAEHLFAELNSFKISLVQILIISILVFFIISYFVSTWYSKPIRHIIYHLKRVTPQQRKVSFNYHRNDEMKELIDATKSMVEMLNLYDERQRRFLSTSSHELKTPLATMQLILENLPHLYKDKVTFQEYLGDLSFQVKIMKQTVDQLLEINRIWEKPLQKGILASQDIHLHLLHSFQHLANDKRIYLEIDFQTVDLYVDHILLLRGLDNLVSNAIRYSPKDKTVKVSLDTTKEQHKISVCDQGIGMSSEDLPHIFEPFYRSNDATAWNQEGSGLGLTIVKQIVELHKGTVEVESVVNQGTCIRLFFPKK